MGRTALIAWITFALSLSACAKAPGTLPLNAQTIDYILLQTSSAAAPTAAPTVTAAATEISQTPTVMLAPANTSTPTDFLPFRAITIANAVNLRAGPGYLLPSLRSLKEGEYLTVWGKSPGGEWFYVASSGAVTGWVYGWLMEGVVDLQEAPVIEPDNAQVIRGLVADAQSVPIRGVVFNILQETSAKPPTNIVRTDALGMFYSFLPLTSSGSWTVAHTGIACDSNVWKGGDCAEYKEGYRGMVDPMTVNITLPYHDLLTFTWV